MSNSINSLQTAQTQTQTDQTVQPPKKPQTETDAVQQDTVTISTAAQQALAGNTQQAAGADVSSSGKQ